MPARILRRSLTAALGSFLLSTSVLAFVLNTDESGVYVNKWYTSPVTFDIALPATRFSDGRDGFAVVSAAIDAWNEHLGLLRLTARRGSGSGHTRGNDLSEVVLDSSIDGEEFPTGVLAVTLRSGRGNAATESDIVFNSAYTWDAYTGYPKHPIPDMYRVALHELGHAIGLGHPDTHGQTVTSIMNSRMSIYDRVLADDIQGVEALYGKSGATVANDNFASAIQARPYHGQQSYAGSNIAATSEPGEPRHAGSSGTRSVWWRWSTPDGGRMTLTTLGSNFDTALAVYSGESLQTLTPVAENDDEEPASDTPNPKRKRTSKVEFDVVRDRTYHVAVDGWADADEGAPGGYTGSITLNFHFAARDLPRFTQQPTDETVSAGLTARFDANVTGYPAPTRQWQRQVGPDAWEDLADDGVYSNTRYISLDVRTTYRMNGDRFRCVATNEVGATVSNVVTLTVHPIDVPRILTQPAATVAKTGVPVTLRVEASGASAYQWHRNGVALSGQTGPSLVLPDPSTADAGEYHVVVSNPGGDAVSEKVAVTVRQLPVVTALTPARQLIAAGQAAELGVVAFGDGPLSYQWYRNGRTIAGATSASIAPVIAAASEAGAYWVAVTDRVGTAHSAPFFVVLSRGPTHLVAWGSNYRGGIAVPHGLNDAIMVDGELEYGIALRENGRVITWGDEAPTLPESFSDLVAISASRRRILGLNAAGEVIAQDAGSSAALPATLRNVWAIAATSRGCFALRTDGGIVHWNEYGEIPLTPPDGRAVAIAAGSDHALLLHDDGTVLISSPSSPETFSPLGEAFAHTTGISASGYSYFTLNEGGSVRGWSNGSWDTVPAGLRDVAAVAAGDGHVAVLKSDGTIVAWGAPNNAAAMVPRGLTGVFALSAGSYACYALRIPAADDAPLVVLRPAHSEFSYGANARLDVLASSSSGLPVEYQWQLNGYDIPGANGSRYELASARPANAGIYTAAIRAGTALLAPPAIVGVYAYGKLAGDAREVGADILHANGNVYDQVLLQGEEALFTADFRQVTRLSFVDLNHDIVQVEMSGPGCVAITPVGPGDFLPAPPAGYDQPGVSYVRGHFGLVIANAQQSTHLSVFSVGRANAVNQSLFRDGVAYDGVADLAFIAILSNDGRFGGLRAGNTSFFATRGYTGIYAPDVEFTGPVILNDISAADTATPVLVLGSAADVRIAGGSLRQQNGAAVEVAGIDRLQFTAGTDSHGRFLPATANEAVLHEDGEDVTSRIVDNP